MRVEHSEIEVCFFESPPQKPFAAISSLAPFSLIAEAPLSISSVIGWSGGSMLTSLHTSDIQLPTVSELRYDE